VYAGFHQEDFFWWTAEFQPTWYTAVASIHQAVIANEQGYRPRAPGQRLRFIASGAASLMPVTIAKLEDVVDAPVIVSYGLGEIAAVVHHQSDASEGQEARFCGPADRLREGDPRRRGSAPAWMQHRGDQCPRSRRHARERRSRGNSDPFDKDASIRSAYER
jgi:acyl-CoA synthetase (AMP-forming)/AMP-acid ligase II